MPDRNPYRSRRSRRPGRAFNKNSGPFTPVTTRPVININNEGLGSTGEPGVDPFDLLFISFDGNHGYNGGPLDGFEFYSHAGQRLRVHIPEWDSDVLNWIIENANDYVIDAENPVHVVITNPAPNALTVIVNDAFGGLAYPT